MDSKTLQQLHERLENGEHLLFNDYGNLNKAVFSCWYDQDKYGKYLQIVGQDGATYTKISHGDMGITASSVTLDFIDFKDGVDIRNYEAPNTELRFLEADRLELEKETLSTQARLIKDYQILFHNLNNKLVNEALFKGYKKELNSLVEKYPEYVL